MPAFVYAVSFVADVGRNSATLMKYLGKGRKGLLLISFRGFRAPSIRACGGMVIVMGACNRGALFNSGSQGSQKRVKKGMGSQCFSMS